MSKLEKIKPKKISELSDIITAKDIAAVLGCSLVRAYELMLDMGEFRYGKSRRVFKPVFVGWLKQRGYEEDKQDEINNPIQMFTGADNRNVCNVGGAGIARRA